MWRPKTLAATVGLSVVLLLAGHRTILQRSVNGESLWFRMSLDATKYLAMVEGQPVSDPLFPPRFLVPWLASWLPLRADQALLAIAYAGLFLMYLLTIRILSHLRFHWTTIAASLGCLFSTMGHLINYSNPFLTDVFALTMLSAMLYCLLSDRRLLFGAAALIGIAGRETCLFGVPVFAVTKRWTQLALLAALSVGLFLGLRSFSLVDYRIPGPEDFHQPSLGGYHPPSLTLLGDWTFWAKMYMPFGFLWVPMVCGVLLCERRHAPLISVEFATLFAAGAFTSLVSSDIIRMIGVVQVVAPVLWAYVLQAIERRSRRLFIGFMILTMTNALWAVPTIWFPQQAHGLLELEDWYVRLRWPITIHQGLGILASGYAVYLLRHQLVAGCREKVAAIREGFAERGRRLSAATAFIREHSR